ncbi:tRNA pseudouridine(55) synthase TruB [Rathayibacter sp. KR2-224]|uniref:tRNA pseudouridine(55) synthase TruB n=1 Tax=Rathayibacter sp. KR2-224 TaxID=3400913 RepID=UPI003C129ACF
MTAPNGILVVDKPAGWTSHDVVARVRRLAETRKVGHAGTLDPMATGVLILGLGPSTRLLTYIVGTDKEYRATIRLGASTTTDDAEGDTLGWAPSERVRLITPQRLADAVAHLTREIDQVPSSVSAVKVDGKRAYAKVRAGEQVELKPRRVTVSAFDVLDTREAFVGDSVALDVDVRVVCTSGTYVRALARDLGVALLTGGHLTALRRTRVGPFLEEDALPLADLNVASALLPPGEAASGLFPVLPLTDEQATDLGHGKKIAVPGPDAATAAAIAPDGRLVGLASVNGGTARTLVNFPPEEQSR